MDLSSIDLASLAPPPFEHVKDEEIQNLGNPRTIEFNIVRGNGQFQFLADGTEYKPEHPPLALPLGAAEELVVYSRLGDHPFHIHVNPFEVVAIGKGDTKPGYDSSNIDWTQPEDYPVWKDTIMVTDTQPVKLRIRYNQKYPGITVYHCHILDHEDQGMMRAIEFTSRLPKVVSAK
jgi:FtsP/CotA-like multicopper oxidase with cupredoxin domain